MGIADSKNCNPIASIYGGTFLPNLCNTHLSESIKGNLKKKLIH